MHCRRAADRGGQYRQLAVGYLMMIYGEDDLNQPAELVTFARQYVQLSPTSAVGHVTLAKALKAIGQLSAATAAFLAARSTVPPDEAPLVATTIVEYVGLTPEVPSADVKALLDYAQGVLDGALTKEPDSRVFLAAKSAALQVRADRVETDPARQKALVAESNRLFDRMRGPGADRPPGDPPGALPPVPQPPPPPMSAIGQAEPPGYAAAVDDADALIERKQFNQAAAIYDTFIKSNPQLLPPHYLRMKALVLGGRGAELDAALKAARTSVPAVGVLRHMRR